MTIRWSSTARSGRIELPPQVDLKVLDPRRHQGDDRQQSDQAATLETGLVVNVPPFVEHRRRW